MDRVPRTAIIRLAISAVLTPLALLAGLVSLPVTGMAGYLGTILGLLPLIAIGVAAPRFLPGDIGLGIAGVMVGTLLAVLVPLGIAEVPDHGPEVLLAGVVFTALYSWVGLAAVAGPAMALSALRGPK